MVEITETWIDSQAPNSAAIKNGQGLVKKDVSSSCIIPRIKPCCSAPVPAAEVPITSRPPTLRCRRSRSCGAPVRAGSFRASMCLTALCLCSRSVVHPAEVPEDLAAKREKAEKREERKLKEAAEGAAPKPKKVNKSALKTPGAAGRPGRSGKADTLVDP